MTRLNPRHKQFVLEYLSDLNTTQAAIRAGYSIKGARVRGAELLANRNIQAAISRAQVERKERLEIEADDVIRRLATILFSDITDYVTWSNGKIRLRPERDLSENKMAAVHSLTQGQHGITIRMHDKIRAAELLGKHLGMFKERNEVDLRLTNGAEQGGDDALKTVRLMTARGKTNSLPRSKAYCPDSTLSDVPNFIAACGDIHGYGFDADEALGDLPGGVESNKKLVSAKPSRGQNTCKQRR